MFGRRKKPPSKVRKLRDDLDAAVKKGDTTLSVQILLSLETLEMDKPRWPHKRGDILRKLERAKDAATAYERAAMLYRDQGFMARAIAMAKVIEGVDPTRTDVVATLDPSVAKEIHRQERPDAMHGDALAVADIAPELTPAEDSAPDETRFSEVDERDSVEFDLTEFELDERDIILERDSVDDEPPEAARLASLPLFPLFAEAPREALEQLARESELLELEDGVKVIAAGDAADALFGIVEGAVKIQPPGGEHFARLGEGDVFGEICLLSNEPRRADVVVDGHLTALKIPKTTLNYLVRVHDGLANLLLEMLTRRLLGNLLHTSRLFAELEASTRKEIASLFEVRRAKVGTVLLEPGKRADGLYITLTGHLAVTRAGQSEPTVYGAGTMVGQESITSNDLSGLDVRTIDNLLVLRMPQAGFTRLAMQYSEILGRIAELEPVASIGH